MRLRLRKSFVIFSILAFSLVIFITSAFPGNYIGSGEDYKIDYAFKAYVQDRQAPIVVGEVNPVPHEESYNFVLFDRTSENLYTNGYNCVDFALDLWRNAAWDGIESKLIGLDLKEGPGHVAVGFPNEEGVLLIVDPMTDTIMNPVVGKNGFIGVWELSLIKVPLETYNGSD